MEQEQIRQTRRELCFAMEEGCLLTVDRTPGAKGCNVTLQATTAVAALKGISLLVNELAELVGCSVDEVLCKLAVIMLAPEGMPESMEGAEYGTEEG